MQYQYSQEQPTVSDFVVYPDTNEACNTRTPVQPVYISDSELALIKSARKRLYVANPKQLYAFRHTPISLFSTFIYFCLFVCSVAALLYLEIAFETEYVEGVGEVSATTPFYHLYLLSLACLLFYKVKQLLAEVRKHNVIRYGLAMLANSFMFAFINMIKFLLSMLALVLLWAFLFERSFEVVFVQVLEGPNADEIEALTHIVTLIIYGYSFRFCSKRYEE